MPNIPIGSYQEPTISQTLRNHAHALCPCPHQAEALVAAIREEAASSLAGTADRGDTRIALLSILYAKWREMQNENASSSC